MISILTATYNNESYITEYLDSVISQTYRDWELILIDDGSTDNTKNIISTYNDSRIKYFYKDHTNLPNSLNFGYNYCNGDYIARADSDDIMLPNRLQWQFDFMESNLTIDMSSNGLQSFTSENGIKKKIGICGNRSWYIKPSDALETTRLWHGSWIIRGNTWRRDKIYYDETYYCGQDFEYLLNCISHGWVLYNDKTILMWKRHHENGIVEKNKKDVIGIYNIIREKYKNII